MHQKLGGAIERILRLRTTSIASRKLANLFSSLRMQLFNPAEHFYNPVEIRRIDWHNLRNGRKLSSLGYWVMSDIYKSLGKGFSTCTKLFL